MTQDRSTGYGVVLLRVSLGAMYLAHSLLLKLVAFGLAGTVGYLASIGPPGWLAYLTFAAEAPGGAMLVLGIQARWVAMALSSAPLGTITWAHGGSGWVFTAPGGGWESLLYLLVLSAAQVLLGDGPFALHPSRPPRRP